MNLSHLPALALLLLGAAPAISSSDLSTPPAGEFVGTTPPDPALRAFIGGLDSKATAHCLTWHLTLSTNQQPTPFTLTATYGLPGRNDPNQIETGPTATARGTCDIIHNDPSQRTVYHLKTTDGRSIRFTRLGQNLLHFVDPSGRLMVGHAGWSFTLNRKGLAHEN